MYQFARLLKYLLIALVILCYAPIVVSVESRIPVLVVGGTSYTNVVVMEKTAHEVLIRYDGGIASLKVRDLNNDIRSQLGLPTRPIKTNITSSAQQNKNSAVAQPAQGISQQNRQDVFDLQYANALLLLVAGSAGILVLIILLFLFLRSPRVKETSSQAPEDSDELTQVLDGRLPLSVLIRQGDTVRALSIYAQKMQRKYSPAIPVGSLCAFCQRNVGSIIEFYRWAALVDPRAKFTSRNALLLLVGWISITVERTVLRFETAHCFCPKCAGKTKLRRGLSVIVRVIAFLCLFAGLAVGIVCGAAVLYSKSTGAFQNDGKSLMWWALAGFVVVVIGILGYRCETMLQIPSGLRVIGRSPFHLSAVKRAG